MKTIRRLALFLGVVCLLLSASCAAPEATPVQVSPVVKITATLTATSLAQKPARTPTRTLAPTPTPTPGPSFAYDPDNPYAALRAYMDAEIAEAPDAGPAPFEADMLNDIMRDLWYYGRFSECVPIAGRKMEYVVYASSPSWHSFYAAMLTDDEDIGFVAKINWRDPTYFGDLSMEGHGVIDGEEIVPRLQEETESMELVYRNTVTIPEASRGQERALNRPEMRDAVIEAALAYVIDFDRVEKGRYTVVIGDYGDKFSARIGSEGCLEVMLTMYIRGKTSEGKDWETFDYVFFDQAMPGDKIAGEFFASWAYPNAARVEGAFPSIQYPRTEEGRALDTKEGETRRDEELSRRSDEYADYQWQRLLDQGLYAKEITVE